MPFAFLILGAVFVVAGVRNTSTQLTGLLKGDFTGSNNFIYWMISILLVGAIGYIKDLQPVSRAFLVLIIIVLILSNKGFFNSFNQQISSTQSATATPTSTPATTTPSSSSSVTSAASSVLNSLL